MADQRCISLALNGTQSNTLSIKMQYSWVYRLDHNRQTQCKTSSSTPPLPHPLSPLNQSINQPINQSASCPLPPLSLSLLPLSLRPSATPSLSTSHPHSEHRFPAPFSKEGCRKPVFGVCVSPSHPLFLYACMCARVRAYVYLRARVCVCVCVNVRARANTISRHAASCAKFPEHVLC